MINQEYVYHSSKTQGLKVLEPKVSTHKTPWVYATKDIVTSALFLGHNFDFICQVGALGEHPFIWERFEGAFDLAYKDKKGSIYYLKPDTFKEGMTSFSLEVVSEVPVKVEKELLVDNVQEYLLNLEREGKLKIFTFPNIPVGRAKNKEDIVQKAINWTIDFGEHVLKQVEEYHPDVLDRVIDGLKEKGYEFKSEEWLAPKDKVPKTVRIGDTSSLEKRRRVNTSAGCFLVKTEEGNVKLLVIKKVWLDGTTKYVLPKGHKEGEETLEDTALREVREESGYSDISLLRYLGSATYELDWEEIQLKTDHYFLALLNSEKEEGKKPEIYEDGVVLENQWRDVDEALGLLTYENYPEINELVKKYIEEDITPN